MNQVVRLGDRLVRQGVLAMVLFVLSSGLWGQQQKTQDQSVPDAPTPQEPDSLGRITSGMTPGKGAQETPPDQGTNTTQVPPSSGSQPSGQDQIQQKPPEIPAPGEIQKGLSVFRTTVNYVIVPVTVLDKKHQQVAGLTWRDFQIFENGQRQAIAFFSADAVPLSVALVIDQSLPRDTMKKVNDSLAAIQGGFTASDEIAVFTYADGVTNPTDFTAALSARIPAVLEKSKKEGDYMGVPINGGPLYGGPTINGRSVDPNLDPQRGNSGVGVIPKEIHTLNDAILAAGKSLSTRPQGSRRIVYVISDGKESRSKANFREVVKYLESNQVAVYGTLVGDSATWGLATWTRSSCRCCRCLRITFCPGTRLPRAAISPLNSRKMASSAASRNSHLWRGPSTPSATTVIFLSWMGDTVSLTFASCGRISM